METEPLITPLLEKAEAYGKTSIELLKLKAVDTTADLGSTVVSRSVLFIPLFLFTLTVSVAAALWLGEVLEKNYYGFLVVAAFYALLTLVLFFTRKGIKAKVNDSMINKLNNSTWKRSQA